jgi:hypothetical protein
MKRKDFLKKSVIVGAGLGLSSFQQGDEYNLKQVIIYKNYLRGCEYYRENLATINLADDLKPTLVREPENRHDKFAIAVYLQGKKVGYIAAYENVVIAKMLDQGVKIVPTIFIHEDFKNENIYYISNYLTIQLHTELLTANSDVPKNNLDDQCADDVADRYRGLGI